MNQIDIWLATLGLPPLNEVHYLHVGIALLVILFTFASAYFAEHRIAPAIASFWKRRAGHRVEGLSVRMPKIVRHLVAALVLAIALNIYDWQPFSALPLGVALGVASALAMLQLFRGLSMPRWIARIAAFVLFVALVSHSVGGLEPITRVLERIGFDVGSQRFSLLTLTKIIIVSVALFTMVRLANRLLSHSIDQAQSLDATQKLLAQKVAAIAVIVAAFFIGIDLLQIDLTAFAIFGGGLGLAVGFGMQKTVGNLFAGILLLMDRSIKPGDVIVVGDSFGWVNKIGFRAVSVVTRDGKEHLIPNENLMTQEVENWSYSDRKVRVRIPVGVSYNCDLKLAQELMLRAATESPRVLPSPKPNVWLTDYGDSAVNHEILAWISDPEGGVGNVRSDVLNRLWWLFKDHGIEIPFPQRDVHVRSLPPQD